MWGEAWLTVATWLRGYDCLEECGYRAAGATGLKGGRGEVWHLTVAAAGLNVEGEGGGEPSQ